MVRKAGLRIEAILVAGILSLSWGHDPLVAETSAERLGFPPEAKVLILQLNDAGLCFESNQAILELIESHPELSTSVLANAPWFHDFVNRCPRDRDVGLSFTLNSNLPNYRWRPMSAREGCTLIDADGYLWSSITQTVVNASREDVEHELLAQVRALKQSGFPISHLGTHLGTLYARGDLAESYLRLSREYWIPAPTLDLTPERLMEFRRLGFPLEDELAAVLASYPLPRLDDFKFPPTGETLEEKRAAFLETLRELEPGLTQINVLPAVESDALKHLTDLWRQRVWDYDILRGAEFWTTLQEEGILLVNWRDVMRRFDGGSSQ
jgi:predicted glycoside hydrolase/deacetylase ChbG (UPF0249 family)